MANTGNGATYNLGVGATGNSYTPAYYATTDRIGKIAYSVLRKLEANNPFSVFKKQPINNGDTIEQSITRIITAQPYNKEGKNALHRWLDQYLVTRYYKTWSRNKYPVSIDYVEIRAVLEGNESDEEVARKIVSMLSESDTFDNYTIIKELLKWGRTSGNGLKALPAIPAVGGNTDYKAILRTIKDTVKGMQYVSNNFNGIGNITVTHDVEAADGTITPTEESVKLYQRSRADEIYVIMPYKLKNAIDVDELAGVFNLDKAEIRDKIIEIDSDEKFVYIVDEKAIMDYTKLYELLNNLNEDGCFWNFVLHTERLYAICPLFNACYFAYDTNG